MNPGAAEQGAKVATSFIDTMKAQPLALALVVMNMCLLALFWFIFAKSADLAHQREQQMFVEQKDVRELLAKCVVPQQGQGSFPNLTPTFIAARGETREQKLEKVFEPQRPVLDIEGERKINTLLQTALDEALHDQIKHLFDIWLKDETDQPRRAGVGARAAVKAYRDAMRALKERERKLEQGETVQ